MEMASEGELESDDIEKRRERIAEARKRMVSPKDGHVEEEANSGSNLNLIKR